MPKGFGRQLINKREPITHTSKTRRDFLKTAAFGAAVLTLDANASQPANIVEGDDHLDSSIDSPAQSIVYAGTFKREPSKGIYAWKFDATTGKLESLGLVADTMRPVFVCLHPHGKFLYAVSRPTATDRQNIGVALAYSIDSKTARLTLLNSSPTRGIDPAYASVDLSGRNLMVANFGSNRGDGCISVFPIKQDGSLVNATSVVDYSGSSVHPQRQTGPHSHAINVSPDNRFVLVADLGLDKMFVYRFDAEKGKLTPNDPPFASLRPGSGPRHFVFHANGKFLYVVNELNSTLTIFRWSDGILKEVQTISTLPRDFTGANSAATLQVHPSARFLYASNRGADNLAIFSIDEKAGTLTPVEFVSAQGKTPGSFSIDPSGRWLIVANQSSDSLVVFRVDVQTGKLGNTGQSIEIGTPSCVRFLRVR
ncbi:MAG TPA: lactonase family protein [Pyrinomonadaceae bacterium]|nr:lactonase family protein [Pyrinomonadaceae bacterium]